MVKGLSSPQWDLEKRHARELAVIRERKVDRIELPGTNAVAKPAA
jgi:hypothetical protein